MESEQSGGEQEGVYSCIANHFKSECHTGGTRKAPKICYQLTARNHDRENTMERSFCGGRGRSVQHLAVV